MQKRKYRFQYESHSKFPKETYFSFKKLPENCRICSQPVAVRSLLAKLNFVTDVNGGFDRNESCFLGQHQVYLELPISDLTLVDI